MPRVIEQYAPGEEFLFPSDDQRIIIIGRTGSGKTQFANSLLSNASFTERPWIIFDFKGEEFFDDLKRRGLAKEIPLGYIPEQPGVYFVRPIKGRDDDAVEEYLWKLWEHENVGIFVDELYMIDPRSDAFQAILTQGRSKNIPMINLTQRPVAVSRFNFSEASHIVLLDLNHRKDRETVAEHMPIDKDRRVREYYARWYDVNRNKLFLVQPAPGREAILKRFSDRLTPDEKTSDERPARIIL